jgi:hypothetical protein
VVAIATVSHNRTSVTVNIVPSTLNAGESSSAPNCTVADVKTPIGKVNPHQPMLKGICSPRFRIWRIEAMAMESQTRPKPQMVSATLSTRIMLRYDCKIAQNGSSGSTHGTVAA